MVLSRWSLGFCRQSAKAAGAYRLFSTAIFPRAAVAATIQWTCPRTDLHHYLLVQRKNPPDEGNWAPPGGKILLGESTLEAARREVEEETGLRNCRWQSNSFMTTDAIVAGDNKTSNEGSYLFHYVIAHCFAKAPVCSTSGKAPPVVPSDDAMDAKWYTLTELRNLECSEHTLEVLERAEELSSIGFLSV